MTAEFDNVPHPAANDALRFLVKLQQDDPKKYSKLKADFELVRAKNFHAAVCFDTMRRLDLNEQVADREVLGLAWTLRNMLFAGR